MLEKVLIANRGEIAVRVIRTCRQLGIASVAIYSEPDRDALHVRLADSAYPCGGAAPRDSYLRTERVLEIAQRSGADAIHPGYGFLAESADFSDRCADIGIVFIGPSGDVIRTMGEKATARDRIKAAGVPVVPGSDGPIEDAQAESCARRIGFPVMVKASAGGGGKGLRRVEAAAELVGALERVRGESRSAFGDDALYLERYVEAARHIEVQFIADSHGTVIGLGERECSIQRRHQKLIEETPANAIGSVLREAMGVATLAAAKAVGYQGAGTCEFLLGPDDEFFFLEMNTRIQVEHAITEAVTGIDIVAEMIRVAAGEPLGIGEVQPEGHAIETRIYAEDPDRGFAPSP
ncbi:MAG: biotin carboxylase N-terminal domain-containing protein, partial [Myxococcota bacterium]